MRVIDSGMEEAVMIGEEQLEYAPISVVYAKDTEGEKLAIVRWTLTPEERARIGAGEDLALVMHRGVAPHYIELWRNVFPEAAA